MAVQANAAQQVYRVEQTATPDPVAPKAVYGVVERAEWIAIEATRLNDPFEAVKHEHRISNRPPVVRESDELLQPVVGVAGERYKGPHGRLLTFKKRV
jgi:hypothetical protein